MEGYSVTEAASVLGVPTERVWELLARGVLSGSPDGETGMRVYLQPRPAPAPAPPGPSRSTVNGGPHEPERGELSPFRELLTEFRNLTERYGQALLALGEARGEVAALRSRVDLLEARMDLRLPPGGASNAWEPPMPSVGRPSPMPPLAAQGAPVPVTEPSPAMETGSQPEPEPELEPMQAVPEVDAEESVAIRAEPDAAGVEDDSTPAEGEARAVRRGSPRHAVESFAEALARAEDPSIPELPAGPDAAAALAALRGPSFRIATGADDLLPREVAPAEAVPVADEAISTAPVEAPGERVSEHLPAEQLPAEHLPAHELPAHELPTEQPPPVAAVSADDAQPAAGDTVPDAPGGDPDPADQVEPGAPAWRDERYTAEIAEPDWFEGEAIDPAPAEDVPVAADDGPSAPPHEEPDGQRVTAEVGAEALEEPAPETDAGPPAGPPADRVPHGAEGTAARASSSSMLSRIRPSMQAQSEETVLWFGRRQEDPGADVAAGRGARDLDDALSALDALSRATPSSPPREPIPEARRAEAPVRRPPPTPATRAYRRLRRIFPG